MSHRARFIVIMASWLANEDERPYVFGFRPVGHVYVEAMRTRLREEAAYLIAEGC